MTNHRNIQNYRFRTWKFRNGCHLKGGVCQGCFLSILLQIEINKTIDLGHGNLEMGATSKVEYARVAS